MFYPVMLGLYALTLFVSATLLFLVQPMVGKMILPYLGGTPAVWNTSSQTVSSSSMSAVSSPAVS